MKFGGKLGNVKTEVFEIEGIEVNVEMSLSEVAGMVSLTETSLKKLPEYFEDLAAGFRKFQELDKEFSAKDKLENLF